MVDLDFFLKNVWSAPLSSVVETQLEAADIQPRFYPLPPHSKEQQPLLSKRSWTSGGKRDCVKCDAIFLSLAFEVLLVSGI